MSYLYEHQLVPRPQHLPRADVDATVVDEASAMHAGPNGHDVFNQKQNHFLPQYNCC